MPNHFPIKNSPGCLESLALNESTDFASKNFILFAKVLRSLLAPRWTLHLGSSPNARNFKQRKSRDKPDLFLCNKKLPESSKIRTLILDLHETIKCTPNSYFKLLQDFVTNFN